MEYIRLWNLTADGHLSEVADSFRWRWTTNGKYTAMSAYAALHQGSVRFQGAARIWKNWAPPNVKFFVWLAARQRIWTADRRRRHGLDPHDMCWFCDPEPETCDHILVNSTFAKQVWWDVISALDCTCSFSPCQLTLRDWWTHCRQLQVKERRKGFDTLFMLIAWFFGRNGTLAFSTGGFRPLSTDQLLETVKSEVRLLVEAGARRLGCLKRE